MKTASGTYTNLTNLPTQETDEPDVIDRLNDLLAHLRLRGDIAI